MPPAFGQRSRYAWTWAITSCRSSRSYWAARSKSMSSTARFSSAIWASEMLSPSSCSASASATHSLRHVVWIRRADQRRHIVCEA